MVCGSCNEHHVYINRTVNRVWVSRNIKVRVNNISTVNLGESTRVVGSKLNSDRSGSIRGPYDP